MHKYGLLPTTPLTGFRNDLVTANRFGGLYGGRKVHDIDTSSTKFIVQWFSRLNVGTVRQKWKGPNSKECSSFGGNFPLEDFELVFFTVQSAKNRGGNQEIPNGGRA